MFQHFRPCYSILGRVPAFQAVFQHFRPCSSNSSCVYCHLFLKPDFNCSLYSLMSPSFSYKLSWWLKLFPDPIVFAHRYWLLDILEELTRRYNRKTTSARDSVTTQQMVNLIFHIYFHSSVVDGIPWFGKICLTESPCGYSVAFKDTNHSHSAHQPSLWPRTWTWFVWIVNNNIDELVLRMNWFYFYEWLKIFF